MVRTKAVFIILLFLAFSGINTFAQKEGDKIRRTLREKLRTIEEPQPFVSQESILQKILEAYKVKDYERVVILEKSLPRRAELKIEEMQAIAESLWLAGEIERAVDWAKRIVSLRRGTLDACRANLIILSSYYLLEKHKEAKALKEEMKGGYCGESLASELSLLEFLNEGKQFEGDADKAKKVLAPFLYAKFNYLLKKGSLEQAEKTAYRYLALTGDYYKGSEFFFKLGEAYLKKGDRSTAKRYYQLVISEWDLTKESLPAKFRLYQFAYEKARGREALPKKTYEDLLGFITMIKSKYEELPIAEEASVLEFEIYFDLKSWNSLRSSAKDFLSKFPNSQKVERAKELYCKAMIELTKNFVINKRLKSAQEILAEDEHLLQDTKCGDAFYMFGDFYFQNHAYLGSLGPFTKALLCGVDKSLKAGHLLKLAFLAFQKGEKDLFKEIFLQLERKYKSEVSEDPYYLYLKAYELSSTDLKSALNLFERVRFSPLPTYLKSDLINYVYKQAVGKGNLNFAYEVLKHPAFNAKESDYVLLLTLSFNKDPKLFEAVFADALKKYPDSPRILLISALYYEKKGNLKESVKAWQRLAKQNSDLATLGQTQKKLEELFDKARGLVY